jgi:hypothetical protein
MTEEAKAKRREYFKQWRKANKEKAKEYNARYWEKKAQEEGQQE